MPSSLPTATIFVVAFTLASWSSPSPLLLTSPPGVAAYSSPESPLPRRTLPRSLQQGGSNNHHHPINEQHHNHDEHHPQRPLVPPFPDGPCGGTVVTIPRVDLFPDHNKGIGGLLGGWIAGDKFENPLASLDATVLPPKDVSVWVPKEYGMPEYRRTRFPVLYCHDGQNAMEDASSWTGSSWRLIGALTRLYERNMLPRLTVPPLVVLLPSAEGSIPPGILRRRHAEYGDGLTSPASWAHSDFVAKVLHPHVLKRFRTVAGDGGGRGRPEDVAAIGTSLGGQASLSLLLRHPDIFGAAACLSPCFQAGTIAGVAANLALNAENNMFEDDTLSGIKEAIANVAGVGGHDGRGERQNHNHGREGAAESTSSSSYTTSRSLSLRSKTIYIDNGGDVGDDRVPFFDVHDHFTLNENWWNPGYFWLDTQLQMSIDAVRWALEAGGCGDGNEGAGGENNDNGDEEGGRFRYEKFPGGRHNERAWSKRIDRPLLHLYGNVGGSDYLLP